MTAKFLTGAAAAALALATAFPALAEDGFSGATAVSTTLLSQQVSNVFSGSISLPSAPTQTATPGANPGVTTNGFSINIGGGAFQNQFGAVNNINTGINSVQSGTVSISTIVISQ